MCSDSLKQAFRHERSGNLCSALSSFFALAEHSRNSPNAMAKRFGIERIAAKARNRAKSLLNTFTITPLIEHSNTPNTYSSDTAHLSELPPIISLTTISQRVQLIDTCLNSIIAQSLRPHSINLYISHTPYLIDEGIPITNPLLQRIGALGVNVYAVPNIGPYRKQLPIILQLRTHSASGDTPLVTMDDDVIYPSHILKDYMLALNQSDVIVAHRGRRVTVEQGRVARYNAFGIATRTECLLNLGTGRNGIAYRLKYFPSDFGHFAGHILAPTADDLWCRWATWTYFIPTLILEPRAAFDPSHDFESVDSRNKLALFHKYNARGTNDDAVNALTAFFSHTAQLDKLLDAYKHD